MGTRVKEKEKEKEKLNDLTEGYILYWLLPIVQTWPGCSVVVPGNFFTMTPLPQNLCRSFAALLQTLFLTFWAFVAISGTLSSTFNHDWCVDWQSVMTHILASTYNHYWCIEKHLRSWLMPCRPLTLIRALTGPYRHL